MCELVVFFVVSIPIYAGDILVSAHWSLVLPMFYPEGERLVSHQHLQFLMDKS